MMVCPYKLLLVIQSKQNELVDGPFKTKLKFPKSFVFWMVENDYECNN